MFRSRRWGLVRRLWRHRCTPTPGSRGQTEGPEETLNALKASAHNLFKRLRDEELEVLVQALASRGRWDVGCIWGSRSELRLGKQAVAPQVLLCRLYRWPDLRHAWELKRLCFCEAFWRRAGEGASLCCNPYHYSRLCNPDTPPPGYAKAADPPRLQIHEGGNSEHRHHSWHDTTISRNTIKDGYWCKLAYWEHRARVGRLYAVHEPSVQIFSDLPKGSGFCLDHLDAEVHSDAVRRTRGKIGQGLMLSQEQDGVWAYNCSEHPIFVNAPTLASPSARSLAVHKVPPGYSMKVFDSERTLAQCSPTPGEGPWDPDSARISFAKGWGPRYSRQFITSCPCWLEILLNRPG
ncbi:mothers against decapentaplegic homolog 6-like [Ambystoma mexicanum]|uniref:mothers against decapentaplegic homolog 6-like n=1 Tax=Ambystoma mexicanum TaxID=8296 RepID=UPI0037E74D39